MISQVFADYDVLIHVRFERALVVPVQKYRLQKGALRLENVMVGLLV